MNHSPFFVIILYIGRCLDLPSYPENKAERDTFSLQPPNMLHLWPTSLRFRKIIFPNVIVEKAPFEPRNISHFRFNCVVLRRISIFLALPKNVKVCRKSACASEMFSTKNNQLDKNKIKDASLRLPSASLAPLLLNILASLIIHALFKIRPTSFFFQRYCNILLHLDVFCKD